MIILLKLLATILFSLLPLKTFAQNNWQFQMDGSFPVSFPNDLTPTAVAFNLRWNERENTVQGRYRDNTFAQNAIVTGTVGATERVFTVNFPRPVQGVSSLSFIAQGRGTSGGTLPLQVFVRDTIGTTLGQYNTSATITVRTDTPSPDDTCDIGFGALSDFCGLYAGTVTENSDGFNRCNLTSFAGFRLELRNDGGVAVYADYLDTTTGVPSHELGTFDSAPLTSSVSLSNRHCGALTATNFSPSNCQRLYLGGDFTDGPNGKTFRGIYSISDEITSESCSYGLNLELNESY